MLNQPFQQGNLLGTRNIHELFPWFFQLEDFLNYNKKKMGETPHFHFHPLTIDACFGVYTTGRFEAFFS